MKQSATEDAAVRLDSVRVEARGRVLLQVPQLAILAGERVAIVGPNGAGKSTLLRLLAGLAPATEGRVEVLGRLAGHRERVGRAEVALMMQGLHLVPRLSARENVVIGALGRLHGADRWRSWLRWYPKELLDEADAAIAALGLAERTGTRTDRLSGGERQKTSLARLQLQRARLVLADEPTSALDPSATAQVCAALLESVAAPGHTLVAAVHDLDLLPRLATRVIGIAAGQIRWDHPIHAVDRPLLDALYGHAPAACVPIEPRPEAMLSTLARA